MIMIWAMKALGIAKRIPWPVWAALAILFVWWIDRSAQYREGRTEGREAVLAELRDAEAESREKADIAAGKADTKAEKRALVEAEVRAANIAAIEEAEANETNPLDILF